MRRENQLTKLRPSHAGLTRFVITEKQHENRSTTLETTSGIYEIIQCTAHLRALVPSTLYNLLVFRVVSPFTCILGSALLKPNTVQDTWICRFDPVIVIVFIVT